MEVYLGMLRRPEDVESIRSADSIKMKVDLVGTLLRTTVNFMKTRSDKALGFLFDDVVTYFEVGTSLGRLTSDKGAHKSFERIAELEGKVKKKEEEINRLGDGGLDSEEKLTGLKNMMLRKEKEIEELKESAQKTERKLEDFRGVVKA